MAKIIIKRVGFSLKSVCVVFILAAGPAVGFAQDYIGASAVLRQVEERNAKPAEKPVKLDEAGQLHADIKAFNETVTNLAPADAAKRWLELADRAVKTQLGANGGPFEGRIEAGEIMNALPPPTTWNELAKAIAARPAPKKGAEMRESGLRLLAATLTGDMEERKRVIADLQKQAKDSNASVASLYQNYLVQLSEAMLKDSDDPDVILKNLERQLSQAGTEYDRGIEVPNLVAEVGKEKAEAFLRKALVAPKVTLGFRQPSETSRLAQSLAMELMDQLKSPQWSLVNSLDSVKLYEALEKHFGIETNSVPSVPGLPDSDVPLNRNFRGQQEKGAAQIYYMLGLISQDRAKEAVAVAKRLGSNQSWEFNQAFEAMEQAGYTSALDTFLYELLSQDPTLPFWDQYVDLAAKAGQTGRMLDLVQTNLVREDFSDEKKVSLRQILFKADLAADKVDDGVEEIRRLMVQDPHPEPGRRENYNAGQLAVLLARIGILTQRPEWTEEGINAAKKWLATQSPGDRDSNADEVRQSLAGMLIELKRGPEAELLLTDALAAASRLGKNQNSYQWGSSPGQASLAELVALYHQAGRQSDVLTLLEQSSDWGVKDLSELFDLSPGDDQFNVTFLHTGASPRPVPYLAADAMLTNGQKEQARKITYELLTRYPGLDRGYELLLALDGTNAIPKLDELFAHDQFEERPLIWKGHLLREEGKLEESEKVIRQAVSIDPSDGEEGRGDRMRVYTELAEIRDARGDKKEADFYREVVKAIRMSEDADQLYQAGLLRRAIAMYETALNHFADAYCIQSRLAIQMADLGLEDQAEEHYRRAYELMPDSFGRVESHCFGCERAFNGERAQSIAEKVFTKMADERPDKPQIHYLLGYLRQEEDRFSEARTNYLTAVRLDPQYLNAWVKLQDVSEDLLVSTKDRDEAAFNILRLDPLGRHTRDNFSRVSDLSALWNAMAEANSQRPMPAKDLFTLTASKVALEKKASSDSSDDELQRMQMQMMEQMEMGQNNPSPAAAVAENSFVKIASQMFMDRSYGLDE